MTNLERYFHLTETLDCPTSFLKAAWLFSVTAALERRVYFGDPHRPLHANQYIVLVGPAGLGKGLALSESKRLLNCYNLYPPDEMEKPREQRKPLLDPVTHFPRKQFNCLPDATTFESVVRDLADSHTSYKAEDGSIVTASCAYFLLEELASLLRPKKSEDVARFLLNMYDNKPYKYKTATAGGAHIEQGCLNLIAGTTPDFFKTAEEAALLGEGLLSRFLLVAEAGRDRESVFFFKNLTKEQLAHQLHLQNWLSFLGHIYGQVTCTDEAVEFLETFWKGEVLRLSLMDDERLQKAFSRRKVHIIKMAIAFHFSEYSTLVLTKRDFEQSITYVHELERSATELLLSTGNNKTYGVQKRLVDRLRLRSPQTIGEVMIFLAPHLDMTAIASVLDLIEKSGHVVTEGDYLFAVDPETKTRIVNDETYKMKNQEVLMPRKA